jgi:lipopolysaccharide export system permease protein
VQMVNNAGFSASTRVTNGWLFVYVAPISGVLASVTMLWIAQRPRRHRASSLGPNSSLGASA